MEKRTVMAVPQLMPLLLSVAVLCAANMHGINGGSIDAGDGLNDDVIGLIVFKSGIIDPSSALATWNEDDDTPCGTWSHIECNPLTGRVTSLSLSGLCLSGHIPSRGLEKLAELQSLSLSNNNLSGPIPPRLALVPSLRLLNLSGNTISGTVPVEFSRMTKIQVVDLSRNSLSGYFPETIFENGLLCSSLRYLDISGNALEGPIPSALSKCGFLLAVNLSGNRFSGSTVSSVFSLQRLRLLDLSRNYLNGVIPEGLASLHNLKELRLNGNGFTGQVPAGIGLCPHLRVVDLSGNFFTGGLPSTMQRLSSLTYLNTSNNNISGEFPEWVGGLVGLRVLDISNNKISGSLPASLGNLRELNYLGLEENDLDGVIPVSISKCDKLSAVKLGGNAFNGSIPSGLFDLGLDHLDLSSNSLTGPIPPGSTRLFETLRSLDLSRNKLTGDIPPEMALYFNLRYLNLSWNDLRSRLPPELGYFRNLSVLDLRNSALYGSFPGDLCDSDSLAVLQLDRNLLGGPIPEEIGNCSSLYLLSLSHNTFNGSIPRTMSKLRKLKILNLEYNNLTGEIPQELGALENLLAVNISHNRLIGRLPASRIFQSLDESSLQGNLGICSPLVVEPCKMDVPKPLVLDPNAYRNSSNDDNDGDSSGDHETTLGNASAKVRHKRFLSISVIVAITAATVIILGVLVVSLLNVSARRRLGMIENAIESMCTSSTKSSSGNGNGGAVGQLVLFEPRGNLRSEDLVGGVESLLNKATEVGRGVFGTVYKASIGGDGQKIVAVKKLMTSSIVQFHEDFDREVRILGKARHPNLMAIRGFYWTPHLQLLISDYAPQGNLHTRLHKCNTTTTVPPLTWSDRFKIALGTAKALAHLHHSFRPPIIHYNLKPSNILLSHDNAPLLSDFGLARLLPKLDKHTIASRLHSALGYVAPELACQSIRINEKVDIYGFGVLVLELVTGRKAVEYGEEDVVVLVDQVKSMLEQGSGVECVDGRMGDFPEEEVLPVLKLGLVCASQIPSSRPSMAEVVQILQVIKTPVPERMEAF